MARALLVAALAGVLLMPGCVDSGTFDDLWTDLEAEPKYEERSLFNEQVDFSPSGTLDPDNPPSTTDDASHRWSENITIPEGTRSITVLFTVNFTKPGPSDGVLPENSPGPDGQIEIFVRGPDADNETQNVTYEEAARGGFDFNGPTAGDWTLGFEARGEGTVTFRVFGTVLVADQ